MEQMTSVACRSVPNKDGNGAVGCGKGWTQPADGPTTCPTCNRTVVITDRFITIDLKDLHP